MMEHITVTTQNTDFHSDISEVIGVRIEMDSGDLAIESLSTFLLGTLFYNI